MRVWDNDGDESLEVNLLPMIDVIFAILAFFIVSTLFLTRVEGFGVNLPDARNAAPQTSVDLTVTIQPSGAIALNGQPLSIHDLAAAVETAVPTGEGAIVTIQADEAVSHGAVIAVMDTLRPVEGVGLALATESAQPE
ncbi:MAG: biopolymer transporter ExbD [Cyanobacteria bacterium]|nr:biopolymer transporter ExbD [Cyanobacteriota bacterium]MEB3267076.1 biopolymer transporter ExbD [Leptolyngbya sp.]